MHQSSESELDKYFGPRKDTDSIPRKSPDEILAAAFQIENDWCCEAPIKPLLNAFFECWPECVPHGSRSSLYASARELHREIGEDTDFVRWARRYVDRKAPHLDIKDMRSLMFLVPRYRKANMLPEEDRSRYFAYLCPDCGASPCICGED